MGKNIKSKTKERIKSITARVRKTEKEMEGMERRVDKATKLIEAGNERLRTDKKALFDALRMMARNMFFSRIRPFRPILDNFRNDHQLLRALSRAHGYVTYSQERLLLERAPTRNYQPVQRRAVSEFLDMVSEEINENSPMARK